MNPHTNFQIIGGGLIGLSTAYALLRAGATSVRVIEAAGAVAAQTSFANAGMVHASFSGPWNRPGIGRELIRSLIGQEASMILSPWSILGLGKWGRQFLKHSGPDHYRRASIQNYKLAAYSILHHHQWRKELGLSDDLDYQGRGLLKIYRTLQSFEAAKINAVCLRDQGLDTQVLNPSKIIEKEPALLPVRDQLSGGLYFKDDFKADAYRFAKALEKEILKKNGQIITGAPVTGFITNKSKITGKKKVVGVKCGDDHYPSDMTIIATGARSYQLAVQLGHDLPVRPLKGYSLSYDGSQIANNKSADLSFPKIAVVDDDHHTAITPLHGGLRIAGIAEVCGFNASIKDKKTGSLLRMLQSVYPEHSAGLSLKQAQKWHGFRPVSADGMPIIGPSPTEGIAYNTGHGHMGWTNSVGAGILLADWLIGKKTDLSLGEFSLDRSQP